MPVPAPEPALAVTDHFKADYLEYYGFLPIALADGTLRVLMTREMAPETLADLRATYDEPVIQPIPVSAEELHDAIRQAFAAVESVVELVRDLNEDDMPPAEASAEQLTDVRDLANQPPVIRFVNLLIREAHQNRASDIHLDAAHDGLRIRVRLDGVLTELPAPPPALQAAVVSRIKLLAELDIAERRLPQDGRVRVRLESRELDLRVSTVPTLHGESVVLRLLDRGGGGVTLEGLGMEDRTLAAFRRLASRAHGIVLSTGPTGSGKTTTLYAALRLRDPAAEKVITVEDPVEYHLAGITQVPVHPKSGMTFAAALRSILRQDPDVLMVGEMRDPETAAVALQAAMTGHLVFSTLHTNDAVSALTRLADLGVEPYMIAATVEGILAQRLVRTVCRECVERYRPDPAAVALLAGRPVGTPVLERGRGCRACRETGYRGRTGIFELLSMNDELRNLLSGRPDVAQLRQLAREQGMRTLREDGWAKVQAGLTTVGEVMRVVQD